MKNVSRTVLNKLLSDNIRRHLPLNWQAAVSRVTASRPKFVTPPDDGKVRLNLGSGDMRLPGYLNVDQAPERGGHTPDIISDVRKLELPDNYADEIMAIHLFEHFFLWEVDEVLKEWRRVLKPNGLLVLELPDLIKSATNLLRTPKSTDPKEIRLSVYGFYGDPNWNDPIMIHKWGWTRTSLETKLKECGFDDVRHELPIFHQLNRDMRVTSRKMAL